MEYNEIYTETINNKILICKDFFTKLSNNLHSNFIMVQKFQDYQEYLKSIQKSVGWETQDHYLRPSLIIHTGSIIW